MVRTVSLEHGGVKVVLISTGAAILSIHTPDRNGVLDDIVLGHPTVEEYTVRGLSWAMTMRASKQHLHATLVRFLDVFLR